MRDLSIAEPIRRWDGSWAVAIYRHGIREVVGKFKSEQDALKWIKDGAGPTDDSPPPKTP